MARTAPVPARDIVAASTLKALRAESQALHTAALARSRTLVAGFRLMRPAERAEARAKAWQCWKAEQLAPSLGYTPRPDQIPRPPHARPVADALEWHAAHQAKHRAPGAWVPPPKAADGGPIEGWLTRAAARERKRQDARPAFGGGLGATCAWIVWKHGCPPAEPLFSKPCEGGAAMVRLQDGRTVPVPAYCWPVGDARKWHDARQAAAGNT